ncbi:STAS domain-containing protein [Streptomyces sp. M2CJ-2]|uniref:STAS domain-containing protein n=1 Tax=Streptomyces sp. M2CJ-2 TaxID=2803948 RepID=UPI001924E0FD|nr:STAS domain-containing protein [Streptomyces sp. M2CJ-2]MBL3666138.1 STAS domain-containing protein [Streptomyces sp. M2CJ-2]
MPQNPSRSVAEPSERTVAGTTVVTPRGELDLRTVPVLSRRLDALTDRAFPDLVLDLRAVSFIDCSGLGVLCRARNRVLARGGRLRLITDRPSFLRVLHHVRLTGVFELLSRPPAELDAAAPTVRESH